jgi:hypothetical protein
MKRGIKTETKMITRPHDPWQHPYTADARCPDGKIRRVRLNQQADSFFSWPGRVQYQGKTRKCYVYTDDGELLCAIFDFANAEFVGLEEATSEQA